MDVFAETKLQRDGIELSTGFRVIKVSDDLIAVKYKSSGGESLVPYGMVVNISSNYRCSFVFGCMIGGRTCRTRSMCRWCTRRCRQEGDTLLSSFWHLASWTWGFVALIIVMVDDVLVFLYAF